MASFWYWKKKYSFQPLSFFLFLFFFLFFLSFQSRSYTTFVIELNATWSTLNSNFSLCYLFSFRKKKSKKKIGNKLVRVRHVHFYPVPAATRQSSEYINDPFLCYALIIIYRINTILASWRYNFHLASYTQKNSNNNQFIFFLFFFSTSISHFIDWNYSSSYDFYDFDNSFLFKKKKRKKKSCDEICPSFFLFFFFTFSIFLPFLFSKFILCILLFTHATEHHFGSRREKNLACAPRAS